MINISFDNPYLLLLLIPMALAVIIPFAIAVRRENSTKSTTLAIITHLMIVVLSVLAVAGMTNVSIITKTELYVLADVSYSTHSELELMDSYIEELEHNLPGSSRMGVITFGKDVKLNTPLGKNFKTVKNSGTDPDATDIVSALEYASGLFGDGAIKRIVVYTDGLSTDPEALGVLSSLLENMKKQGIYIDFVYIDSSLGEGKNEIQISGVEYTPSVYKDSDSVCAVFVESNTAANAVLKLSKLSDGEKTVYAQKPVELISGLNTVDFYLDTSVAAETDYELEIIVPDGFIEDTPTVNNSYILTQRVSDRLKVLIVTDKQEDVAHISALYGDSAEIVSCVKPKQEKPSSSNPSPKPVPFDVPFMVEELVAFDEIVLSNVDVRGINNAETFIRSLNTVVATFGKSLITAGNNSLQSGGESVDSADAGQLGADILNSLTDMLPVKFGNSEDDPKLYAIVLDCSRSMELAGFYTNAKAAAGKILKTLRPQDSFMLIQFWGNNVVSVSSSRATEENIDYAIDVIDMQEVKQGTMMGDALSAALVQMKAQESFSDKYMMLISDGRSFVGASEGTDSPKVVAKEIYENGILLSTLNIGERRGEQMMQDIASIGGGNYYFAESVDDLNENVFEDIRDEITATDVRVLTDVNISLPNDLVLEGVESIPSVNGYVYAKQKTSAKTVLYVNFVTSSGEIKKVPLYAYWSYGSGRVSTITTDLGGELVAGWADGYGRSFLENIVKTNIPEEKIDYPYTVNTEFDGKYTHIEILPAEVNHNAEMNVTVTCPDGRVITERLTFDSYRYFYKLETGEIGKYTVDISYDWQTKSYKSSIVSGISYSPEYDRFDRPTPAVLYTVLRDNGTVTEGENVTLTVNEDELATYKLELRIPLLIAAAVLYIIDTVIRKLKWIDVKSFFGRKTKEARK